VELGQGSAKPKGRLTALTLHQQVIVWAAKANIDLVLPADNYFALRYVNVK
jgi:hypothetical protein